MGEQPGRQGPQSPQGTRVRRPRLEAWVGTGAVAGVVVGLLLAVTTSPGGGYSRHQVALYLVLVLGVGGAIVLGGVGAFLDSRADRRAGIPRGRRAARRAATDPAGPAAGQAADRPAGGAHEQARRDAQDVEERAEERSAGGRPPAP